MKEKIKELRVRIDGLSQLVEGLEQGIKFMIDLSAKPENITVAEWLEIFKQTNFLFVDGFNDSKAIYENVEIKECHKNLILAKAWLGKVLGELGENTPYSNDGKRKTVKDIEPAADKPVNVGNNIGENTWYNGNFNATESKGDLIIEGKHWSDFNHIEKVDWLRQEIKNVQKEVHTVSDCGTPISGLLAWNFIYQHLCEARFWLGFELQGIKENG